MAIIAIIFYTIIGYVVIENKKPTNKNQIAAVNKLNHVCPEYSTKVKSSGAQPTKVKSFQMELVETSPIPEDILQSLHDEETKNEKL